MTLLFYQRDTGISIFGHTNYNLPIKLMNSMGFIFVLEQRIYGSQMGVMNGWLHKYEALYMSHLFL